MSSRFARGEGMRVPMSEENQAWAQSTPGLSGTMEGCGERNKQGESGGINNEGADYEVHK